MRTAAAFPRERLRHVDVRFAETAFVDDFEQSLCSFEAERRHSIAVIDIAARRENRLLKLTTSEGRALAC